MNTSETGATVFRCAKCGLGINGGTYVNGILVCDWCKPRREEKGCGGPGICSDCSAEQASLKSIRELEAKIEERRKDVAIFIDELQAERSRSAKLLEALENCAGGDLASGEGIYKAEIARKAIADYRREEEG